MGVTLDAVQKAFETLVPYVFESDVNPPDALYFFNVAKRFSHDKCQELCWKAALENFSEVDIADLQDHDDIRAFLDSESSARHLKTCRSWPSCPT